MAKTWWRRATRLGMVSAVVAIVAMAAARVHGQGPSGPGSLIDGAFSAVQAARGEETFKQVCAACHNIDDMSGQRFRSAWADQTAGDLFEFLTNAMPQGDPGSLTPEQYTSIIAFFLSRSGYLPGTNDLPVDKTALSTLRIVALPK